MVFGFNTDIRHGDVVYHVQSELRSVERLLQSQVFVRGRCIGKYAAPLSGVAESADHREQNAHEQLKAQHRNVVDAIREGKLEALLAEGTEPAAPDTAPPLPAAAPASTAALGNEPASVAAAVAAVAGPALAIECLETAVLAAENTMAFRFRITAGAAAVAGAKVITRLDVPQQAPAYQEAETGAAGTAELRVALRQASQPQATLLVQASYGGKSITSRFRLRRS